MQHEQSFADAFNSFMRRKALARGARFHSFSLDGQDRDAGADYLLTDSDRFAIVEFKYTEHDLVSEKRKTRRLNLCKGLQLREDMQALHDRCHFVSWTEPPAGTVQTNIYRNEICTRSVFGDHTELRAQFPFLGTRASAALFADHFFGVDGTRSVSLWEFEAYIAWVLVETSSSTTSTLELMAYNDYTGDLAMVRLRSLAEVQTWVREHVPPPPTSSPREGYGI